MDGFPTAGGRNPPSAVAKVEIFGMLFLTLRRACLWLGVPVSGGAVGFPTAFLFYMQCIGHCMEWFYTFT